MNKKQIPDGVLVAQALSGNQDAYRKLIARYRNAVYGTILSYVDSFDQAEDFAQEAFIRGYYRLHTLKEQDRFGGWLRRIAENLCRMEIRRKRILPIEPVEIDHIPGLVPTPEENLVGDEERERVFEALDRLPQKEREAVTLYYLDGERVAAVSEFLGISQNAVKARLHRARQTLRVEMMTMAKQSLKKKKLGQEFAKGIDIKSFGDLTKLSNEDLEALHNRAQRVHMAWALVAGDDEAQMLKERLLDVLSDDDRRRLELNLDHIKRHEKDRDPYDPMKYQIVRTAQRLQDGGDRREVRGYLPRKPSGTIEVETFDDMDKLYNYEIQTIFRQVDTVDLAAALMGKQEEREKAERWANRNVSRRVWGFIDIERKSRKISPKEVKAAQKKILDVVHELQWEKAIRPSKNRPTISDRLPITKFGDLEGLMYHEMQTLLREVETMDLAVAFKGKGVKKVEALVYRNVSARVQGIIEKTQKEITPTVAEVRESQAKILEIAHALQVLGRLRPGKRGPTAKRYEGVVETAGQALIDRLEHSSAWRPKIEDLPILMPLLAKIVRDEGIEKAKEIFRHVDDPVFTSSLYFLGQDLSRLDFEDFFEDACKKEMTHDSNRRSGIYQAFLAIHDGEEPRKVAEVLREL